ncbi:MULTISPECIES: GLPGLI family protein [Chryseobacterium]|uniref:GLPGLI family protein n=1 Tax=Chryseobacterium taihuense TaxID=1141221 RepID=A0A4U8WAM1_9FLAO|nr:MULTISPECIES: GLPGLI family protein [Chryseobacterium]QQV01175.1 GLPGLI family protein [Chryseobacterium sp. FDAARGOS 1104]VFB02240.1 GLPGLI family protein [Chryseobacterium taihuense]
MKKIIIIIFIVFISTLVIAQNKRFTYEYQFIPDSANISDVKTETMNLDVSADGSKFYSYTVFQADSLSKIELEKQLAATGMINIKADSRKGSVRYSVSKRYPKYEVSLHNRILMDQYKVAETRPIKWKIISEKQKIAEWNVQKAEADFAGRHWNAWFTTEIPIQDGPYKFHGLPGLIVKLEDNTKSHIFTLQGIRNIDSIPSEVFSSKKIAVNLKQYDKIIRDYENDPTKGLKILQSGGITMKMIDDPNNNMKEHEQRQKAGIKKNNNRIELNTVQ